MANGSILTNGAKKLLLNRAYKTTPDYNEISDFKVGVSNGTPSVTSTDLDTPVPITGMETVDDCEATTGWSAVTNSVGLNSTTYKRGSGALDLIKIDTSSANVLMSKTTTALDFTSKDLWFWVYLDSTTAYANAATTDCLTVRFGTDSSNYYVYTRDKADLAAGWNYVKFNTSTADSTTGSPTITNCAYTFVQFTTDDATDTLAAGKLIFDQFELASAGDYYKNIDSSYPVFDETNNEVELQAVLPTTDAIGFSIDGFALSNDDSTRILATESTFTAESKSSSDEFIFIEVHRIE